MEESLDGGWQTTVHRVGDVVLRSSGPQSATVMRLLGHLRAHGFGAAPRPIDGGVAPDGREQLGYIEGASPQPLAWTGDAPARIGAMLREVHGLASTFEAGPDDHWRRWFGRQLPGNRAVIGHCHLGPWNILARDDIPVAFIDWDNAGPVDAVWELAQVAWLNAQLHDVDVTELNDLPPAATRIGQCADLLDGYGLDRADRAGFVDKMIEFAIRSARDEAVIHEVGPDTESPANDGFPVLWGVTWRTRAAAWMLDHRGQIAQAVGDRSH